MALPSLFLLSSLTVTSANATQPISMNAAYKSCIACHGEQGQGNNNLKAPALAGLSVKYLTRQLVNFKTGLRGSHEKDALGKQMQALSKQLVTNKDVTSLTAYVSAMPRVKIKQASSGDLKNGSRYYQGKCGACHGGQAQGNPVFNAPKLSGQHTDYLKRQMLNFSRGIRGTHADDKLGRQMAMMAKTTSGKELDDIFHFIAMQD